MKCLRYTRSSIKRQNCGKSLVTLPGTFTCTNVITDGRVVCFIMGSTKITVSTPYLRPIPRFGMYMVISYLFTFTMSSGLRMRLATVRCFTKAMKYGNKFIYQTVPRLLTIWLDMGEDPTVHSDESFTKITAEISRTINGVPAFKVRVDSLSVTFN